MNGEETKAVTALRLFATVAIVCAVVGALGYLFSHSGPQRPANIAAVKPGQRNRRIGHLLEERPWSRRLRVAIHKQSAQVYPTNDAGAKMSKRFRGYEGTANGKSLTTVGCLFPRT